MAAFGLIEGRDANQAVYADFTLQQSKRVFAVYREGGRLQPRLFPGLVVIKNRFKSLTPLYETAVVLGR